MPRGIKQDVVVSGRPADGGLTKEEEKAAKKAMDDSADTAITARGGTDIPQTEPNPEAAKQRAGQEKLEQKQADFASKQAADFRSDAQGGGAPPIPMKEGQNTQHWKWVRLLKGYVPMTAYCVMEGETVRVKSATVGRVLDKVQAGSVIGLPSSEAGKLLSKELKLAERADDL